jgi:hypothetical protein
VPRLSTTDGVKVTPTREYSKPKKVRTQALTRMRINANDRLSITGTVSLRTLGLDNVKCDEQTHNGPGVILQIVNAHVDRLDGAIDYVHGDE